MVLYAIFYGLTILSYIIRSKHIIPSSNPLGLKKQQNTFNKWRNFLFFLYLYLCIISPYTKRLRNTIFHHKDFIASSKTAKKAHSMVKMYFGLLISRRNCQYVLALKACHLKSLPHSSKNFKEFYLNTKRAQPFQLRSTIIG